MNHRTKGLFIAQGRDVLTGIDLISARPGSIPDLVRRDDSLVSGGITGADGWFEQRFGRVLIDTSTFASRYLPPDTFVPIATNTSMRSAEIVLALTPISPDWEAIKSKNIDRPALAQVIRNAFTGKIVTSYPNITRGVCQTLFSDIEPEIEEQPGKIETMWRIIPSTAIVDVSSSGRTIEANECVTIWKIFTAGILGWLNEEKATPLDWERWGRLQTVFNKLAEVKPPATVPQNDPTDRLTQASSGSYWNNQFVQ